MSGKRRSIRLKACYCEGRQRCDNLKNGELSIGFFAMLYSIDFYDFLLTVNLKKDAIFANPHAPAFYANKLCSSAMPGIGSECVNFSKDTLEDVFRNGSRVFPDPVVIDYLVHQTCPCFFSRSRSSFWGMNPVEVSTARFKSRESSKSSTSLRSLLNSATFRTTALGRPFLSTKNCSLFRDRLIMTTSSFKNKCSTRRRRKSRISNE